MADLLAACSGIAVSAPRTADGKLYFARNWDMTPQAMQPYLGYIDASYIIQVADKAKAVSGESGGLITAFSKGSEAKKAK